MTSDTLRQKFIYNTPFNDDGFPLLNSRLSVISEGMRIFCASGKHLLELEQGDFDKFCDDSKDDNIDAIVIIDDYHLQCQNPLLLRGIKAHLMSFCYLFQQKGFYSAIVVKS